LSTAKRRLVLGTLLPAALLVAVVGCSSNSNKSSNTSSSSVNNAAPLTSGSTPGPITLTETATDNGAAATTSKYSNTSYTVKARRPRSGRALGGEAVRGGWLAYLARASHWGWIAVVAIAVLTACGSSSAGGSATSAARGAQPSATRPAPPSGSLKPIIASSEL